jgi:hypothetical protein
MATITVRRIDDGTFAVALEGSMTTTHTVTADAETISRIGGGFDAETVIEATFRFLLDREPQQLILGRFDLPVIASYFSDYPDKIGDYLGDG